MYIYFKKKESDVGLDIFQKDIVRVKITLILCIGMQIIHMDVQ